MLLPLRVRTAAPASLRSSAGEKLFALPPPEQQKALRFESRGTVDERRLETLASDFTARDHVFGGVAQGGVGRFDRCNGLVFFAAVEDDGHETIGFDLRGGRERKVRIHELPVSTAGRESRNCALR